MKKPLSPLGSHRYKIAGFIVTIISVLMLSIVVIHGPLNFLHKLAHGHQFNFFLATLIWGMCLIAFSKEKKDDERVRAIRAKALQRAFSVTMTSSASFSLAFSLTAKTLDNLDMTTFCIIPVFGLAVYLIAFHIGLYFEPYWAYNDEE